MFENLLLAVTPLKIQVVDVTDEVTENPDGRSGVVGCRVMIPAGSGHSRGQGTFLCLKIIPEFEILLEGCDVLNPAGVVLDRDHCGVNRFVGVFLQFLQ